MLGLYWDYIGITENKMETIIVYWGYIGVVFPNINPQKTCSHYRDTEKGDPNLGKPSCVTSAQN